MKPPLYTIHESNFKTSQDGAFRTYDLVAQGDTLEQLLENATYFLIDQEGEERDQQAADDNEAVEYITAEFERLTGKVGAG